MTRYVALGTVLSAVLALAACKKGPPADSVCSYEPLPATSQVPKGQGGVMIQAATDTYFYAQDTAGKQLGSAHVNALLPLKPGEYRVKVNNSVHPTIVQSGMLARCSSGGILVKGATDEYYYMFDGAGTQLASAHVGGALSLFPGSYQVRLNNSRSSAQVQAGATVDVTPGVVNVEAPTDEYYYVFDTAGTQLANSHVGRPLGLFSGSYTIKLNNSASQANVQAGQTASIPAGTLLVEGSTDEYYYVFNAAGTQLASAHLGRPLAVFPGTYSVKLNNSTAPANVGATAATVQSGSITVQGSTDEYYYVFDHAGTQLASAHLGRPLSFVPGEYSAKVNNAALAVRADAGRANEYPSGTITVKSSGSDYYYVLDAAGTQLASKQFNQPVSLPAGQYTVKVGSNTRPATVTAGKATVISW